jgi:transposase
VVFYDLTTIRAEGHSQQDGDVRHFGMSKEGVIARQFMLGVVQTADGMPIYHEVFDGNTAEAPTLEPTLKKVLARSRTSAAWSWWPTAGCSRWTTSRR